MTSPSQLSCNPFHPTLLRLLLVVVITAAAFLMPQEAPLVFYPLNDPSPGTLQLQIKCASTVTGTSQFFLDSGAGFNEVESIRWPMAPSRQSYTYTFPLPDAPLVGLRLDPWPDGEGEFTIAQMRLIERNGREVRRFTKDDFRTLHQIDQVVPLPDGWKLVAKPGASDPGVVIDFPGPIVPRGMNLRNAQRCLLSWGYLALMLWILLLAVYFALMRGRPLKEIVRSAAFLAEIALLFAAVGNRGLIKESVHSARFHAPATPPGMNLEFDLIVQHPSPAQLFWDTGAGFNEKQSVWRAYEAHEAQQTLRFPLPADPLRGLRFDPLTAEGRLVVRGIRVVDQARRTRHIVPLTAMHADRQIEAIEVGKEDAVIRTVPGATDPIIVFATEEVKEIGGQ